MKYYYMDDEEIKIRKDLKKLTSISFTYLKSADRLIIKCMVESGELFSYDTRHKYFELFFEKLKQVYREEKDKRNIIILDENVKKIMDSSIDAVYPKTFTGKTFFKQNKISYQKQDIKTLKPIIDEVISLILGIQGTKIESVSDFKGIRENFSLIVITPTRERVIPIKMEKINDFSYKLILGNMYGFNSVEMNIDFYPDNLWISWSVAGMKIYGNIKYLIGSENVKKEVEVYYNNKVVYIENNVINPVKEELPSTINKDDTYNEYAFYNLDNDLMILTKINKYEKDTLYVTDNDLLTKIRNTYRKNTLIENLECPTVSMKRVVEEYKIEPDLSLMQIFYDDVELEESLYRDVMSSQVQFKVYYQDREYTIENEDDVRVVGCLDSEIIKLILERKDK